MSSREFRTKAEAYLRSCTLKLDESKVPLEWKADLLSYVCASEADYAFHLRLAAWLGTQLGETYRERGRRVAFVELSVPIIFNGRNVCYVEFIERANEGKAPGFSSLTIVPKYGERVDAEWFALLCEELGFAMRKIPGGGRATYEIRTGKDLVKITDTSFSELLERDAA